MSFYNNMFFNFKNRNTKLGLKRNMNIKLGYKNNKTKPMLKQQRQRKRRRAHRRRPFPPLRRCRIKRRHQRRLLFPHRLPCRPKHRWRNVCQPTKSEPTTWWNNWLRSSATVSRSTNRPASLQRHQSHRHRPTFKFLALPNKLHPMSMKKPKFVFMSSFVSILFFLIQSSLYE